MERGVVYGPDIGGNMTETKKRGRPPTGFDKKTYDRDRMRRIRAGISKKDGRKPA